MPSKSLINPHAPSSAPRMVGRHSDKISQSLDESEKQLRRAREKRARRGAVRLEAAERGQIERAPVTDFDAAMADDMDKHLANAEAETSHQGPDQ